MSSNLSIQGKTLSDKIGITDKLSYPFSHI